MRKLILALLITLICVFGVHSVLADYRTESNKVITKVGNPQDTTHGTAPPPPADIRQGIIDQFGITMNGFQPQQLQWAWEKFWDVSHTNFIDLVRGTEITAFDGMSEQTGCRSFLLRSSLGIDRGDETLFKVVLIHEMGHIIYHCNVESKAHIVDHENAFSAEGGMTLYGETACYGTEPTHEDYAEMIAYYLNPGVIEQTACGSRGVVPFADGKYPLHFMTAKEILGDY
jgi:hypothetical protein